MVNSKGYRRGTRYMFSRPFRKHGIQTLKPYLQTYKIGDYVNIKGNGAVQKGMPHKVFHGKTGKIFNVTRRGLGVTVNKRVQGRIIAKRVCVRIDHVVPNYSRVKFLQTLRRNMRLRKVATKRGLVISTKQMPEGPRKAHIVRTLNNKPQLVRPIPYEFVI